MSAVRREATHAPAIRLTEEAVVEGERLICICRLAFCVLVLFRFYTVTRGVPLVAYVFETVVNLLAMGVSVAMLLAIRRGRATRGRLAASIVTDAVGCFLCLLCHSLWPAVTPFTGTLARPDPTAILIMIYSAGFRFSPALALLGGILNTLGFAILMVVEHRIHGATLVYGWSEIFFFSLAIIGAAALAVATAARTRSLVASTSSAVTRVERARRDLTEMARDQHDARSLLSAANLTADRVWRALGERGRDEGAVVELAGALKRDLSTVNAYFRSLGELVFGQLVGLRDAEPAEVATVVPAAAALLEARYPEVTVSFDVAGAPSGLLAGGGPALERVLHNLVANAVEGDGVTGAGHVHVRGRRRGGQLELTVTDDGPGFSPAMLKDGSRLCRSTKPRGSGMGLFGIARLIESGGGQLALSNLEGGGACVTICLPIAENEPGVVAAAPQAL